MAQNVSDALAEYGLPGAGAFQTRATDEAGFYQDLADFVLTHRRTKGAVSASTGVTKPTSVAISTVEDFLSETNRWLLDTKARKGGAAYDMIDTHPNDTYRQRRYDFIAAQEGVRTRAYDDYTGRPMQPGESATGNVTVGIGFNMDRTDARRVFNAATGLTDKEFDEVYRGQRRLSNDEVRALFDWTAEEAEQIVHAKFKDVNLLEHQRLALVSLAFNGPSLLGPKLEDAIRRGDWSAARDEILYNSNAKRIRGLANRRYHEASMFVGASNSVAALPSYKDYIKDYA